MNRKIFLSLIIILFAGLILNAEELPKTERNYSPILLTAGDGFYFL